MSNQSRNTEVANTDEEPGNGIPVIYFQVIGLIGSIMLTWILILVAAVYFRWCKPSPDETDSEQGINTMDSLKNGKPEILYI